MAPCISADGLAIFYAATGGKSHYDLWMTTRPSTSEPWGPAVSLVSTVNSPAWDYAPSPSYDGSILYFESDRPGSIGDADIWQAPIVPILDLNDDGIVDVKDIVVLAEHWGTDGSLCDVGPMPWGDGTVDIQDLLVLADYLDPAVKVVLPIAHWTLDEAEGFAGDSVGDNLGHVLGGAVWEPNGGQVDGAIRLDGVDDCIVANPVVNPEEGPFSVFACVQGGAPGQVIVSGAAGANWLMLDAAGRLMTEIGSSLSCVQIVAVLASDRVRM